MEFSLHVFYILTVIVSECQIYGNLFPILTRPGLVLTYLLNFFSLPQNEGFLTPIVQQNVFKLKIWKSQA